MRAGRAGRPGAWFAVAAALNGALVAWPVGHGGAGSRAVDWSLAAFCIAVAARHDGIVRTSRGRPDVGACVAQVAPRFDAVFVVSNDVVRDSVARACEALGMPWYGPTFDS
jgi:hypothetical protein